MDVDAKSQGHTVTKTSGSMEMETSILKELHGIVRWRTCGSVRFIYKLYNRWSDELRWLVSKGNGSARIFQLSQLGWCPDIGEWNMELIFKRATSFSVVSLKDECKMISHTEVFENDVENRRSSRNYNYPLSTRIALRHHRYTTSTLRAIILYTRTRMIKLLSGVS